MIIQVDICNMAYNKLVIAAMLLICLLPMPYGYFLLVRFIAMAAFAYFAFIYSEKKLMPLAFTFGALALLFRPFIKVALGRTVWNIADVIVAILLFSLWYKEKSIKNN